MPYIEQWSLTQLDMWISLEKNEPFRKPRAVVWSAIGMILSFVCPSVHPSVMLCTVAPGVGVGSWKLYHGVLAGHFLFTAQNFCCKMYYLATDISECECAALGKDSWQKTQRSYKTLTRVKRRLQYETVNKLTLLLTSAIPDNGLHSVAILYVVRSRIGYHSNRWDSCL